jgi:protein-disulfide isomerase
MSVAPMLAACGSNDSGPAEPDPEFVAALMEPGPIEEHWLGAPDAPVTIIEYASMTCSHCRTFHETVFDTLISDYVDTGEVRFLMREFPLDDRATAGFVLARCAPGANGYYALIDQLFEHQNEWAFVDDDVFLETLLGQVAQAGFTRESFEACLANQELYEGVVAVADRGAELGVSATPTFFINGVIYPGALGIEPLRDAIAAAR